MASIEHVDEKELVVKVKPGTKVRVIEATDSDPDLKSRDLHVVAHQALRISVKRLQGKDFKGSPSTITMCG
jgi:hypothetical protein